MRLVGGQARGRRLRAPSGGDTRPTSAKVRKAVIDILGGRLRGARFLDLFAGSGAVGIEALNHGARAALFVDAAPGAVRVIASNLKAAGLDGAAEIVQATAATALARLSKQGERFDVVFLDPPYDPGLTESDLLAAWRLVTEDGILILEHSSRTPAPVPPSAELRQLRTHRYGDTSLTVFRAAGPGADR